MENRETDWQLLERLGKSDSSAFWELWSAYAPYVRRVCFQMGGTEDDVSDVMMKLLEKLPAHAAMITNLKPWIGKLARNVCIDNFRKRAGRREVLSLDETEFEDLKETGEGGSEFSHRADARKIALGPILKKMSRCLRETFVMHFLLCLSYREIAERTNSTEAGIRKRIQRARALFREEVGKGGFTALHVPVLGVDDLATYIPVDANEVQLSSKIEVVHSSNYLRLAPVTIGPGIVVDLPLVLGEKPYGMSLKIKAAKKYVLQHPRGFKKRIRLARLLRDTGRWSEAIEECQSILQQNPGHLEVLLLLGDMLRITKRLSEAAQTYRKGLKAARKPSTRCYLSALAASCEHDYMLAHRELDRAIEMEPSQGAFRYELLHLQAETGHLTEALRLAKEMFFANSRNVGAGTIAFQAAMEAKKPKEAERLAADCLSNDTGNLLALKCLADLRCTRGLVSGEEGKKTLRYIRSMLQMGANMPAVRETLARFQFVRGNYQEAISTLQAATKTFPEQLFTWFYYARWLFRSGDYEAAAKEAVKTYHSCPHDVAIAVEAANILCWSGDASSRAALAGELVKRFPERFDILLAAAHLLAAKNGDLAAACLLSREATQIQPLLPEPWLRHGEILLSAGSYEEAMTAFEKCQARLPEDDSDEIAVCVGVRLAETQAMMGDSIEGRISLWGLQGRIGEFLKMNPANCYYWEGRLCTVFGDVTGATKCFKKALSFHIEFPARVEVIDRLAHIQQIWRKQSTPTVGYETGTIKIPS